MVLKTFYKYILGVLVLLINFPGAVLSEDIGEGRVEVPDIIVSDIEHEITLSYDKKGKVDITVNGERKQVNFEEGKAVFKHRFEKGDETLKISVDGHQLKKQVNPIPLWLSIVPPLLAIFMALIFKEVIFSLFVGIFFGSAVIGGYQDGFWGIFSGFFMVIDTYIIGALQDSGHLSVILFSSIIGAVVALISKNGGMQGVVNKISRFARTVRSGQFTTWLLGISIFFDDYANTLVVGNTMRPVTDRLRISREKLSYLVDSTAAPIAAVAFVTTWIGAELGYIQDGLDKINADNEVIQEGTYAIFMNSLQYSFYPILTLIFIFMLIMMRRDYGPMHKAEKRAGLEENNEQEEQKEDTSGESEMKALSPDEGTPQRWWNAVLPVLVIIFGTIAGLVYTGKTACLDILRSNGYT
ncbi:MAG: hypothetical protein ABEH43_00865, partial [Flavobacteriales bacterium]